MQHAVSRMLDYWNVLFTYFHSVKIEKKSKVVYTIFDEFNNSCKKVILLFLKYFFNTFNTLFQNKKLLIHELSKNCKKLFKQIISHFILPQYLNDFKINCKNPRHFLKLDQIDLGLEYNNFISDLPEDIQLSIRKPCLEFMIYAAIEMQNSFSLTMLQYF